MNTEAENDDTNVDDKMITRACNRYEIKGQKSDKLSLSEGRVEKP